MMDENWSVHRPRASVFTRWVGALGGIACAIAASGCEPDLGPCDDDAARTPVWDEQGLPLYEGQALVQRSCGDGAFCHASAASGGKRYGAPKDLDFDMALASIDPSTNPAGVERLRRGQASVYEHRFVIYSTVDDGVMPPGEQGAAMLRTARAYVRDDGSALPSITSSQGKSILKNWLACGAPVVERTSGTGTVGDVVDARSVSVEPRHSDIHARILKPTCGVSNCHDSETREADLDFTTLETSYASLVGAMPAAGACFAAPNRVVAGDPDGSLLIHKLEGKDASGDAVCGSPMPLVGSPLRQTTIDSIREWIRAGAAND